MSETRSPLARLVLFMVCLSIAGGIVAGIYYFAVDLPQREADAALNGPPRNDILTNNQEADVIACLRPVSEQMRAECCKEYGLC